MARFHNRHAQVSELSHGRRRRRVQFAIALTWVSFSAFLLYLARLWWLVPQLSEIQVIGVLSLIGISMGMSHGLTGRLTLKERDSQQFMSEPGVLDDMVLALSVMLMMCGAYATFVTLS